jgi:NADH:quinone reductase (non-electrogenic)
MRHDNTIPTDSKACKTLENICLPKSNMPRIVIIGDGFAGLALVEELKHKKVQLVLFDKNNFHQFQPLLYQVAKSALEPDNIVFPFRKQINGYKNVLFRLAEVEEIQPELNTIITNSNRLIIRSFKPTPSTNYEKK